MGQRNVYIPDPFAELLRHEERVNPEHTPGRLLLSLAQAALGLEPMPDTATARVLRVLQTAHLFRKLEIVEQQHGAAAADEIALFTSLEPGVVGETLVCLSRLKPPAVVVVDGEGSGARWALAPVETAVPDESNEEAA